MVTFLLSLLAIVGITLMLYSAVALVQGNIVASAAPPEVMPLIQPKTERLTIGKRNYGLDFILTNQIFKW